MHLRIMISMQLLYHVFDKRKIKKQAGLKPACAVREKASEEIYLRRLRPQKTL